MIFDRSPIQIAAVGTQTGRDRLADTPHLLSQPPTQSADSPPALLPATALVALVTAIQPVTGGTQQRYRITVDLYKPWPAPAMNPTAAMPGIDRQHPSLTQIHWLTAFAFTPGSSF